MNGNPGWGDLAGVVPRNETRRVEMAEMSNAELMQKLREKMSPAEMRVLGQFASTMGVQNPDDVIESMRDIHDKMRALGLKVCATWVRRLADEIVAAVENDVPSVALVASALIQELMNPAGEIISNTIRMIGKEFEGWVVRTGVSQEAAMLGDGWVDEIRVEYAHGAEELFHAAGVTMDVAEGMRETLRQDEKYRRM